MPAEYIELVLCREFHWTLEEVRATSRRDIYNFLTMPSTEAELREAQKRIKTR